MVYAQVAMALTGLTSPQAFTRAAEAAFKTVVAAVTSALTLTAQVIAVNASAVRSSRARRQLLSDGVQLAFTIAVDVRAASSASGKTYAISGAAGSDDWASSNTTMREASALAADVAAAVQAATSNADDDSGLSVWDALAAAAVAALPAALKSGGLSLAASSTARVAVRAGSVRVVVCSWDNPCEAPSPVPTTALPSQVPTPAPSPRPDYTLRPSVSAAVPIFYACIFLFVCVVVWLCEGRTQTPFPCNLH